MSNWFTNGTANTRQSQFHTQQQQQEFQSLAHSKNNRSGPLGPPKPVWKYFLNEEIFREDSTSWRLCVCTVDDKPFVCISSWFLSKTTLEWHPTTRQLNLRKEVFEEFVKKIGVVNETLEKYFPRNASAPPQGRWKASVCFFLICYLYQFSLIHTLTFHL
jgi:hypothetical protein